MFCATAVVAGEDQEGGIDIESGVRPESSRRRDSASSHTTTKSAFVDFHAIYGWKATPTEEGAEPSKGCCHIS